MRAPVSQPVMFTGQQPVIPLQAASVVYEYFNAITIHASSPPHPDLMDNVSRFES